MNYDEFMFKINADVHFLGSFMYEGSLTSALHLGCDVVSDEAGCATRYYHAQPPLYDTRLNLIG